MILYWWSPLSSLPPPAASGRCFCSTARAYAARTRACFSLVGKAGKSTPEPDVLDSPEYRPEGDTLCFASFYATIWETGCSVGRQKFLLLRIRSAGRFRCCADSACLFSGVGTFWIIIMIRPCRDASKSCCKVSAEGGKETAEGAQHRAPFNYSSALAGSAAGTKALPGASSAASARTNVPKIPLMNRTTSGLSYFLAISTASLMAAPSGISGI